MSVVVRPVAVVERVVIWEVTVILREVVPVVIVEGIVVVVVEEVPVRLEFVEVSGMIVRVVRDEHLFHAFLLSSGNF